MGEFRPLTGDSAPVSYSPDPRLEAFLKAEEVGHTYIHTYMHIKQSDLHIAVGVASVCGVR